jgi:hypothetical protein
MRRVNAKATVYSSMLNVQKMRCCSGVALLLDLEPKSTGGTRKVYVTVVPSETRTVSSP